MKLKIDQGIKDFSGKDIEIDKEQATMKDGVMVPAVKAKLTYRDVIENAIAMVDNKHPLTAESKLKAFQIGVKLNAKKLAEYDLTTDQVAYVKEQIGLFYGPIVYGRFLQLIGDEKVAVEKE